MKSYLCLLLPLALGACGVDTDCRRTATCPLTTDHEDFLSDGGSSADASAKAQDAQRPKDGGVEEESSDASSSEADEEPEGKAEPDPTNNEPEADDEAPNSSDAGMAPEPDDLVISPEPSIDAG